ncbi:MAG: hypothetical protein AAF270_05810 [Pseudomonadota bacterium]
MSYLQLISDDHIERLKREEHERFSNMIDAQVKLREESWAVKERWLAIFERCLSPTIACKQADVSISTYRRWRNTDSRFCIELNKIIEEAHENMIGSAYSRATGYLKPDPETESGYEEDATGRPIRHGMSDRLAIALINGKERVAREGPQNVTLNINLAALGIADKDQEHVNTASNVTPLRLASPGTGNVIEAEYEERQDGSPDSD